MEWKYYEIKFEEKITNAFNWLNNEFSKIRTGRVSPNILDHIKVNAYGDMVLINTIANISVPEARSLIIKPYDSSLLKEIMSAINSSNLGINPQLDADKIRLNFPPLTEDMRKDLIKKIKILGEETKVKIRQVRQDIQEMYKKDNELTDDQKKSYANNLDNFTKKMNQKVEEMIEQKSKEIMVI